MSKLNKQDRDYIKHMRAWLMEQQARIQDCQDCIKNSTTIIQNNKVQLRYYVALKAKQEKLFLAWMKGKS